MPQLSVCCPLVHILSDVGSRTAVLYLYLSENTCLVWLWFLLCAFGYQPSICPCSFLSLCNSWVLSCFLPACICLSSLLSSLSVFGLFLFRPLLYRVGYWEPILNWNKLQIYKNQVFIKKHAFWFCSSIPENKIWTFCSAMDIAGYTCIYMCILCVYTTTDQNECLQVVKQ